MKTYNVVFSDNETASDKGFKLSLSECMNYIKTADRNSSYWIDYIGGVVYVVCNDSGDIVYIENL